MTEPPSETETPKRPGRQFGCLHVLAFMLLTAVVTTVAAYFVLRAYVFPREFKPTTLNAKEQVVLDAKIESLGRLARSEESTGASRDVDSSAAPEAYSEAAATRTVRLSERELNALVTKNTDLAGRVAIDLSDDLVSAKILVPMDEDFPVLGGKTLRVKAGASFSYEDGRPRVILRGVTVIGIAVPNAWLGGIKNIDLVSEFGGDAGLWQAVADGIEEVQVLEGALVIRLRE